MKIRNKHIIAFALLSLMTILIVLQILWQRQAYEIEKKDFYIRSLYALNKVRAKLKNANSCVTFFSKPSFMPNEGMYLLKQKWNEKGFYGKPDTIIMYLDKDEIKKNNEIDFQYSNYKSSLATYAELTFNIIYNPSEIADSTIVNESNYREVIKRKNKIEDFFDTTIIRNFIKEKLLEEGIKSSFAYAFVDIETQHINLLQGSKDSVGAIKSTFGIDVFGNDRFMSPQRLVLLFNDESNLFRMSPALLSIGVILLLSALLISLFLFFEKQKKLSDLKSAFIQNLNHEMNTPITNIQLAIDWMSHQIDQSNPEIKKLQEIIVAESNRLQQNIDRSLQIGMLENNTLLLEKSYEDITVLVKQICDLFRSLIEKEKGKLVLLFNEPCYANVDPMHFTNCMSSILDNAIKYKSNERPIQVECHIYTKDDYTIITISDNGRGMSKASRENVFEKFYREDSSLVHNTKGFGIGLSYVKAIINLHGGSVSVKSELNKGCIFEIKLPINNPS
jgi:two-component system phosphate regulon sensor histidine kinase PhoR